MIQMCTSSCLDAAFIRHQTATVAPLLEVLNLCFDATSPTPPPTFL